MKSALLKLSIILLSTLLLVPNPGLADKKEKPKYELVYYQYTDSYPGIFENDRIYRLQQKHANWYGNNSPAGLNKVRCMQAKSMLRNSGYWYGRIDNSGNCREGDPIEWAMGNYLNFLGLQGEPEAQ